MLRCVLLQFFCIACLTTPLALLADDAVAITLKQGDRAPALLGRKWIKGEPIKSFEPGKVYVVEFWATWCGPCIQAMPHATEMQTRYKDQGVIFIGQDVWEEDQAAAEPFVAKKGELMGYRIVMDDVVGNEGREGKMATTWLAAAGQTGIPSAFIIDRTGTIAWIGHPAILRGALEQVIAGTFDEQKEVARQKLIEATFSKLVDANRRKRFDEALASLDQLQKLAPDEDLELSRFGVLIHKKDYAAAYEFAASLAAAPATEPHLLNELAWMIVDEPGLEQRDLQLAEKLVERACKLTEEKDAAILDTFARVQFEIGRLDHAIELQTKAVQTAEAEKRPVFQATVDRYRSMRVSN